MEKKEKKIIKKHEKKNWKRKNEKKNEKKFLKSHPACLWRHWEVWKYHRSIDKWKGYKLRKRYEDVMK